MAKWSPLDLPRMGYAKLPDFPVATKVIEKGRPSWEILFETITLSGVKMTKSFNLPGSATHLNH